VTHSVPVKAASALGHGRHEEFLDFAKANPGLLEQAREMARLLAVSLQFGEFVPELLGPAGIFAKVTCPLPFGAPVQAEVRPLASTASDPKLGGHKALARERLKVVRR
jgi:hypothetical protein